MYPIGLHISQLISQGCEQDVGKGESQQLCVQHLPLMANQTGQRRPAFYGDLREGGGRGGRERGKGRNAA